MTDQTRSCESKKASPGDLGEGGQVVDPQVISDRQRGVMPSFIQRRDDGEALWSMFRKAHYLSWTGRDVAEFVKGWEARALLKDGER